MSASLTVLQVAQLLGMTPTTIRKQLKTDTFPFPARKVGRNYSIPSKPIEKFLELTPSELDERLESITTAETTA